MSDRIDRVIDGSDRAAEAAIAQGAQRVEFHANPVQHAFITSRAKADMFASRKGEGKSAGLVWAQFYHARENPGARHVVIRDTWENLRDSTLAEFFSWFPPGEFGEWKASDKTWTWKVGELGGAKSMWRGMDDKADASKIASVPLGGVFMDEPAPADDSGGIDEQVFNTAAGQLRQRGIKWYACKLAENNPDETHWTYEKFVDPGTPGFKCWQTRDPENVKNLPPDYYESMRLRYRSRPDLVRRFVDGGWGFQQIGKQVTPEWDDRLHLALGLGPIPGVSLYLLWDWGHTPTCIITQMTPLGFWHVLESHVGHGTGVRQFCESVIAPRIAQRFRGYRLEHVGDRAGLTPEQSDYSRSAVLVMREILGGKFIPGPNDIRARVEPLRAVLGRQMHGRGVVQVDRQQAREVWFALRGGWHFPTHKNGSIGDDPVKNLHSHPGDAMGYGAAVLYPLAAPTARTGPTVTGPRPTNYLGRSPGSAVHRDPFARPDIHVPREGRRI